MGIVSHHDVNQNPNECEPSREVEAMHKLKQVLLTLVFLCASFSFAIADEIKAGDLVISQAWSRATPSGAKAGAGYLTIANKGSAPDRLIGGSSDVAGKVEIHEMAMSDGVMKMRPLDKGLEIAPGKTIKLAPSGYHVMLMDLKSQLKQGDKLPITLEFEKAGKVTVSFGVEGVGAQGPAGEPGMGGKMDMKKMDMKKM
jgi:periplasmic copper chaperone A